MPLPRCLVESNFPELPSDFVQRMKQKYKNVERISLATLVAEYKQYEREKETKQ